MSKNRTLVAALAVSGIAGLSHAALITWNGASVVPSSNWTDGGNWVGGIAPVATDSLVFDGVVQLTNTNDFAAGTNFAGITFASTAGTFVVGGSSINLSGDLLSDRAGAETLNTPLVLQNNLNFGVSSAAGTLTTGGAISGGFAITKTGPGVLAQNVASTHTGGLIVAGGIWRLNLSGNTSASLGSGTVSLTNNATLELRSTTSTSFNNAIDLGTGGGQVQVRSNHNFNPTAITGTGALTLAPVGADNLVVTSADMKGWNGQINLTKNGRNGFGLRLASAFVNNSLINASIDLGDATFISRQNGTNQPGTVAVDIGTLSSSATNSSIGGSAAGTGYFVYSIGARNETSSFAGNVNDGSTRTALRKVGIGTLTLAGGASTMSGSSSVDQGTLLINGAFTNANLVLLVNAAGKLGGAGSIAGAVSTSGGTIAPGVTVGSLTVANALSLDAAAVLAYDLDGSNNAVGGGVNDLLAGVTNLTLDGTLNISEINAASFASAANGTAWRLINYTGTLTDNVLELGSIPVLPAGGSLAINTATPGQVNLVLTVPEPTSLAAMGLVSVLIGRRRTR